MKLREAFESKVSQWVQYVNLEPGSTPLPVEKLLAHFTKYVNNSVPVTKAMFGRSLTRRFLKKQSSLTKEQLYYVNKAL